VIGIISGPADVNVYVGPLDPTEFLQSLHKRCYARLAFLKVRGKIHENANPAYLRARRNRPRRPRCQAK
jgi:hypothetical protein